MSEFDHREDHRDDSDECDECDEARVDDLAEANARSPLETARWLLNTYGIHCIDYRQKAKYPTEANWPEVRAEGEELVARFGRPTNMGVILGPASGDVADVDLDCDEAVKLAGWFLPATGLSWGRPAKGSQPTHRLYRLNDDAIAKKRVKYEQPSRKDRDGKSAERDMLVEFRYAGHQSMCPPSLHPDGENIRWIGIDEPAEIACSALVKACAQIAAATLIARNWPGAESRTRHDYAMCLAGVFAHRRLPEDEALRLIAAAGKVADDSDPDDRVAAVRGTYKKLANGEKVSGFPAAQVYFANEAELEAILAWLDLTGDTPNTGGDEHTDEVATAALTAITLFHTPAAEPYACVPMGDHTEVLPVGTLTFKQWLSRWWYLHGGGKMLSEMTNATLQTLLSGRAIYDGEEAEVYTRIAYHGGKLYVNLANERREAVEIDTSGWRMIQQPPVHFRQVKGMRALPTPEHGGSLDELRPLVNLPTDEIWQLTMAWLVGCFHPTGPYAILAIHGEEGTAKSSLMHYLCELVDPSVADKRSAPKTEQDLAIAAKNKWVVTLENVSSMPLWLSDALCRLATGGGIAGRKLYTDDEETLFYARRPIVLNGIPTVATNGDLLSRLLMVSLPTISDTQRQSEKAIEVTFRERQPRLLGALYDAVSAGLREWQHVHLETLPRMADFVEWVVACESAFGWEPGSFLTLFLANQVESVSAQLEASVVARAVLYFMRARTEWTGLATELDDRLKSGELMLDRAMMTQWPKTPNKLGGELTRLARSLRQVGIEVDKQRTNRGSVWTLRRVGANGVLAVEQAAEVVAEVANRHDAEEAPEEAPEEAAGEAAGEVKTQTRRLTPFDKMVGRRED